MLYPRCPTCGTKLAHIEIPFEEGLEKICNNPALSDDKKDTEKMKLVNRFGLKRYCCKRILLTYTDLVKIIK